MDEEVLRELEEVLVPEPEEEEEAVFAPPLLWLRLSPPDPPCLRFTLKHRRVAVQWQTA